MPFVILVFCYGRISYALWKDFKGKKNALKDINENKTSRCKDKIRQAFSTLNLNGVSGKKITNCCVRTEDDRPENITDAADECRGDNKHSLGKLQLQKLNERNGKFIYGNIFRIPLYSFILHVYKIKLFK